jgi:hypothetical protein
MRVNFKDAFIVKIIKVEKCKTCPLIFTRYTAPYHSGFGPNKEYYCTHSETDGMEIENPEMIHPDCPLED